MIRGQNLPAITQIADSDVLIVDSTGGGTRKITYAQLCQAVKQTLGIREVIDSVNITEDGYLMGGKVIADEFAKLNNDITGINTKLRTRTINSGTLLNAALNLQGNGILFFSSDHTPNDVPQSVSEAFTIIIKEHNSSRMHVVLYPYSSSDTNIYTRSIYNSNWLDVWHANE